MDWKIRNFGFEMLVESGDSILDVIRRSARPIHHPDDYYFYGYLQIETIQSMF